LFQGPHRSRTAWSLSGKPVNSSLAMQPAHPSLQQQTYGRLTADKSKVGYFRKNECVPLGQGSQAFWLVDVNRLPDQPEVLDPPTTFPWQRGLRAEWWQGFGSANDVLSRQIQQRTERIKQQENKATEILAFYITVNCLSDIRLVLDLDRIQWREVPKFRSSVRVQISYYQLFKDFLSCSCSDKHMCLRTVSLQCCSDNFTGVTEILAGHRPDDEVSRYLSCVG
jgi:hypothetical protein